MSGSAAYIARLDLSGFRNYRHCRLEAPLGPVVLTGENGAGKTNLLEAISLLAPGRGLRRAGFDQMLNASAGALEWGVSALAHGPHGDVRLGTAWPSGEGAGGGRRTLVDGSDRAGATRFLDHVRLIWLTPAMDRLFAGPTGDRRRFLDRLVSVVDVDHARRVSGFEKLMRERNVLIGETGYDRAWVGALEKQMAEAGVAIAAARLDAIDHLQSHLDGTTFGPLFPRAEIGLEGRIEALLRDNPAVQCEDEYAKMLHDSRRLDAAAGRTLEGPHRSDLAVFHGTKKIAAKLCSTGEQKALLVGMILAQARMVKSQFSGHMPVLLLDEISAHLDKGRRDALFDTLATMGAQSWLTGTDRAQFDAIADTACHFTVADGHISA